MSLGPAAAARFAVTLAMFSLVPLSARADWSTVEGSVTMISVQTATQIAGVNSLDAIYVRPSGWVMVDGQAVNVSIATDNTLWAVNRVNGIWRRQNATWQQMPATGLNGLPMQIAVGQPGQVWLVTTTGYTYRWDGAAWQNTPRVLSNISVAADGTIIGVNSTGGVSTFANGVWAERAGSPGARFVQMSAGSATEIWAVAADNSTWRWSGSAWVNQNIALRWVSAGSDGTVFGVRPDQTLVQFVQPLVTHAISVTPSASGSIVWADGTSCGTSCSKSVPANTPVTAVASPGANMAFASWTGLCAGTTSATCTFAAGSSGALSATFCPSAVQTPSVWLTHVQTALNDTNLQAAGIYGLSDGATWAQLGTCPAPTAAELRAITAAFKDASPLRSGGIIFGGKKYLALTCDDRYIEGVSGTTSILFQRSTKGIVVGITKPGVTRTNVTGVNTVATNLRMAGY